MVQSRRSGLFAAAAVVLLSACAGDAGEQELPAADTSAPAAQPTPPPAGANVDLPEGVTQEMVAQGADIFNTMICFSCHGVNGVGTPLGPSMTDTEWLNIDGSYESIMGIVRTGVPQPKEFQAPMLPMGGIQLTDDQIRQVAAYVYSLSHGG
ncbi:MAG TPA: c-type cytochrome [Longimicrobiales bacterium]|nr:c-type cytochrome [Longimicrobiales bacterium]